LDRVAWHGIDNIVPLIMLKYFHAHTTQQFYSDLWQWALFLEWTISGHVKSRLWVFFVRDKQSDSVCYYMERGQTRDNFEASLERLVQSGSTWM
jgi:hypothetical protein